MTFHVSGDQKHGYFPTLHILQSKHLRLKHLGVQTPLVALQTSKRIAVGLQRSTLT